MNVRGATFLAYARLRGRRFPVHYAEYLAQLADDRSGGDWRPRLSGMLRHCLESVPYYARLLRSVSADQIDGDPLAVLQGMPILTKAAIRNHGEELRSKDLARRRHYVNTSGGSTGEPVRLVQDRDYFDRTYALAMVFSHLIGRDVGEPEIRVWGSERDVLAGSIGWKARFFNRWTATSFVNAFRMSPATMRMALARLNASPPRLIVAYAQAMYELAGFAERESIAVAPQRAIITSAGTLYPFMRERMQRVFGCRVYNRYGSREVGDIACERPGSPGLWIPPWTCHVEVLDPAGRPVPDGQEGQLVVTSLANHAMPLVRYAIGDRGAFGADGSSRILLRVAGRNVDTFRTAAGELVDGEYFTHLMYHRPWVRKFQVVQRELDRVVFRVVLQGPQPGAADREQIAAATHAVMGASCRVELEMVEDIAELASGKYRYTISEVHG